MTLDEGLSKPIGRGLASVLGILKSTGEVGGQKGGKEGKYCHLERLPYTGTHLVHNLITNRDER